MGASSVSNTNRIKKVKNSAALPATTRTTTASRIFIPRPRSVFSCLLSGLVLILASIMPGHAADAQCSDIGTWTNPETGKPISTPDFIRRMATRPVVLLGETHTSAEHHRWQLQVMSALHGQNPNMAIGFEAFPRSVQPVLDQWVQGELSEKEFLEKSRWFDVWRYDPELYMPLFHFARMNRIPMLALNVDRSVTGRVGKKGWAAVPTDQRGGLGNPAKPSPAYLRSLKKVFDRHSENRPGENVDTGEDAFMRFVDVQLTWDRAMAEALAKGRNTGKEPLVIGIVGRGHIEYGYGIPHQLDDLGVKGSAILLPSDSGPSCSDDTAATDHGTPVADAVFAVSAPPESAKPTRPLLGVHVENVDTDGTKAVRIAKVSDPSVAKTAGLLENDVIVKAADQATTKVSELIAIIQVQAPGTWLPLVVLRKGEHINIIAKFPAKP